MHDTARAVSAEYPGGAPRRSALAWCVGANIGVLFVSGHSLLGFANLSRRGEIPAPDLTSLSAFAVAVVALVAWRASPRHAGPWLLLFGALAALPWAVIGVSSAPVEVGVVVQFLTLTAPALTTIGIFGVAGWWRPGGKLGVGAALVGLTATAPLLGGVVLISAGGYAFFAGSSVIRVIALVCCVLAIVGSAGVLFLARTTQVPSPPRPSWRPTIAAALAVCSPLLVYLWLPDTTSTQPWDNSYADSIGDLTLRIGLTLLAAGLVLGAVAGPRLLLAALGTGLLLGPFGMLVEPSVEVLTEMAGLAVFAALGSAAVGFGAALSRWRLQIGVAGLGILGIGLIVVYVLFNSDSPLDSYDGFTRALTPVLLVIGVIGGIAALASIGSVVAAELETPAVFVGLAVPFQLGSIAIVAYCTVHTPAGKAPLVGLLPPIFVGVLVSAVLVAALVGMTRRGAESPTAAPTPAATAAAAPDAPE